MAEFDFYGSWIDSIELIHELTSLNEFTFYVDKGYDTEVPIVFRQIDTVNLLIFRKYKFYIGSERYSRFPVIFSSKSTNGYYLIDSSQSGPYLSISVPIMFEREGRVCFRSGDLMYQPFYKDPKTKEYYKPPEMLKQVYSEIQSRLRKDMVKRYVKLTQSSQPILFWICRDALGLINEDRAGILFGHEIYLTRLDLKQSRQEAENNYSDHEIIKLPRRRFLI